jgi:hypothetical protein
VSVKSSTACTKNLESSEGVIYVYCGPHTDKTKILLIGQDLIDKLEYFHPSGEVSYAIDLPKQKVDILYNLPVPMSNCLESILYTAIKSMNSFTKDWCIKARVTVKQPLRITSNGKSLLKIELID